MIHIFITVLNLLFIYYFDFISKKIDLYDIPNSARKIHKAKIACIGGGLIFFNIFIFHFSLINNFSLFYNKLLLLISFCFFLMGYLDDKYNLRPTFKLLLTVFFITFLVFFDENLLIKSLQFSFISKSFLLNYYASLFFTIFCFIIYINAFNFFDGINLQSAIYSLFIFSIFLIKSYNVYLILSIIIGIIFFIYLNFKNKCFFGNNGSMLLGFLISFFFIDSYNKNLFFADEIFIIMFIPGIELLRLFFLRLSRGQNPMSSDKEHLHHYLLKKYDLIRSNFFIANLIFIPCTLNLFLNLKYSAYIMIVNFFIYTYVIYFLNKKNSD